jgi:hypothetical protein
MESHAINYGNKKIETESSNKFHTVLISLSTSFYVPLIALYQ